MIIQDLESLKQRVISEARQKRGNIRPLPKRATLYDCITIDNYSGKIWVNVWFQCPDNESTGVYRIELPSS